MKVNVSVGKDLGVAGPPERVGDDGYPGNRAFTGPGGGTVRGGVGAVNRVTSTE